MPFHRSTNSGEPTPSTIWTRPGASAASDDAVSASTVGDRVNVLTNTPMRARSVPIAARVADDTASASFISPIHIRS